MTNVTTENVAVFLDFDGTLVDFAPSPEAVIIRQGLVDDLAKLSRQLNGAIAIVTGREYKVLSSLLDVSNIICACEHGSDIVFPDLWKTDNHNQDAGQRGTHENSDIHLHSHLEEKLEEQSNGLNPKQQTIVRETVTRFAKELTLRSEAKKTSITLHYRNKPELEDTVLDFAENLAEQMPELELLKGKCVVEFRFTHKNKGTAIAALMDLSPFNGRTPVFLGDDVTDEFGFELVNQLNGISIKVGEGETTAKYKLESVEDVHKFISALVQTGGVSI